MPQTLHSIVQSCQSLGRPRSRQWSQQKTGSLSAENSVRPALICATYRSKNARTSVASKEFGENVGQRPPLAEHRVDDRKRKAGPASRSSSPRRRPGPAWHTTARACW